jgi:hypothetical protein
MNRSRMRRERQRQNVRDLQQKYGTAGPVSVGVIPDKVREHQNLEVAVPFGESLTLKEAALYLGMKPDTLRKRAASFGGVKEGRFWVFPRVYPNGDAP